jgi:hypothetical protein
MNGQDDGLGDLPKSVEDGSEMGGIVGVGGTMYRGQEKAFALQIQRLEYLSPLQI